MDTQDTRDYIDHIYASIDISHAWIVYDKETTKEHEVASLIDWLNKENYPLYVLGNGDVTKVVDLEHAFRLFLVDKKDVPKLLDEKQHDINNISVIMCVSQSVVDNVSGQLPKNDCEKVIWLC